MKLLDRRAVLLSGTAAVALAACGEQAAQPTQPASAPPPPPAPATPVIMGPPVARVEPVTETFFGVQVTDPYRWMENPKDPEWEPFMKGQDAFARTKLAAIPGREALATRVSELSGDLEIVSNVQFAGPYIFIEKRPAGADNFRLFVREGLNGADRLLVDPETRTQGDTHFAMNYWLAAPDGKHVVYGVSPAGSENAVIEIMETASGNVLPERIDRAQYAGPSWLPDGTGFFFNRLAEGAQQGSTGYYKNSVCWLHKLGTDPAQDVRVLSAGQFADVAIQDIEFPYVACQPGSNIVVAGLLAGVQNEITLFVNTLEAASRGEGGWKPVCKPADKVTGYAFRGDDIWLLTYKGAPRYRVLHVTADKPAVSRAKVAVPESEVVVQGLAAAKDAVYVRDLDGGVGKLRKIAAGGAVVPVELPVQGAFGGLYADVQFDGCFVNLQSWVRPAAIFAVAPDGSTAETALVAKPGIDVSGYEAQQLFAAAGDGARVPVWVVYKKGLPRDGAAPCLVQAYGSYGINSEPFFGPRYIAFMERGGVWATANVRGGGEYGRAWHEAGRLLTKPNTWRDLIACCEHLVQEKWTSPQKLAINGGSAGGIAVGNAMVEAPQLFAAVISQVGVANGLRAEFSQNGPPNIPEFGSVTTEDGFRGLLAMDSYNRVENGAKYPAVLLTTGMTDPRVDPWQAAKMAARLQAASASGKPVLLRVSFGEGHGIGSTRAQRDAEWADIFAFIFWQAGVAGFQPG